MKNIYLILIISSLFFISCKKCKDCTRMFDTEFTTTELDNLIQRIIYNPEMNYATLFFDAGFFGIGLNTQSPNELIDYR